MRIESHWHTALALLAALCAWEAGAASEVLDAARVGDVERLSAALGDGADVNRRFRNGETALMLAARTGATAAIEALLDRGAEIDAVENLRGTSALMWAAANSNVEAVRLLAARGADVGLRSAIIERGRGLYLAPPARERIEEFELRAAQSGDMELLRLLLAHGADPTLSTYDGVQSAIAHPETAAVIRRLMEAQGLPVPPEGRTHARLDLRYGSMQVADSARCKPRCRRSEQLLHADRHRREACRAGAVQDHSSAEAESSKRSVYRP